MPRPPRIELANAVYHVTSRGNARQQIFFTDGDRQRFLRQLRDNLVTYDVVLYAYVLMPNHFHLLVRTRRPNLSRFMQRLGTSYALYYRYRRNAPGHVLQARYRAKLVEEDEYLIPLTRYIHLNPARTAAARRLGRRRRLELLAGFRWSSYPGYVRAKDAEAWVCYDVLRSFAQETVAARRHYRAYVEACLLDDDGPLLEAMRASRYAVGSSQYVARIEDTLRSRRAGGPGDRDLDLPRPVVDLASISRAVAAEFGIAAEQLTQHGRRAGPAKAVALDLACRLTDFNQREIGEYYGGITSMAVCMARRRLQEDPRYTNPAMRRRIAAIEAALSLPTQSEK